MFSMQLGIANTGGEIKTKTRDMLVMGAQRLSSLNHTQTSERSPRSHSLSPWATPTRYTTVADSYLKIKDYILSALFWK